MPVATFSPMVGTRVNVMMEFFDEAGVAADPGAVTATALAPDGTETVLSVNNLGVGIYDAEFTLDQSGIWVVQAVGTDPLVVANETSFTVRRNAISLA